MADAEVVGGFRGFPIWSVLPNLHTVPTQCTQAQSQAPVQAQAQAQTACSELCCTSSRLPTGQDVNPNDGAVTIHTHGDAPQPKKQNRGKAAQVTGSKIPADRYGAVTGSHKGVGGQVRGSDNDGRAAGHCLSLMFSAMTALTELLGEQLLKARTHKPLVHHITNFVVMELTANVTLYVGGSPIMAHAEQEVEDVTGMASCLNLNMGTPDPARVRSMVLAGRRANTSGIPVVLDPVGYGATPFRVQIAAELMGQVSLTVIRGNAGEVWGAACVGHATAPPASRG